MKYTYWEEGNFFIGHLNDFPDYETQAVSREELEANLKDLIIDLESGELSFIRHTAELVIA
jgi:predicted RNase H-like HicB family nuclease